MIPREVLERFESALGDGGVEQHGAVDIDGAQLATTLRPGDGDALARGLEALSTAGMAALIRGGGNRLSVGNLPGRHRPSR